MENIFDYLKIGIVATGTLFTWLLGAWDTPLVILIVLMYMAIRSMGHPFSYTYSFNVFRLYYWYY
ncbi:holin [Clostridium phage phiCp-A]|nr:holin [Clostridium phage phiCp-A]